MLLKAFADGTRPSASAAVWLRSIAALVALAPLGALAADHAAEVEAFARIMADVRTAAEVCEDLSPDWTLVNAEKERLHIADVDYFAFRKQAHDRTEVLEQRFKDEHGPASWCSEVSAAYGPQGTALTGALRQ